ncbi:AraC family transcriptional regulator [Pseudoalteromonas rubra]|uniref:HTH araC/xylS-type domain-containing protein n=1 Tax=Pseudoalteromonas rubra TaxID=43658 RepID=A0A0U3IMR0_9GAMM|nr:helix-turn-helix domain-containing protein [Pseudoalteromonas rubra]ALU44588.1 hypothetical protein AT705_17590 [Pseudoalteromonas rubra]
MDIVTLTNLAHAGTLTVALMGILILMIYPAFRGVCVFLTLVAVASGFNLLESLSQHSGYLVTPIFVIGFGPAIYLAAKQVIGGKLTFVDVAHFLPMLAALPFTAYWQEVIALGTIWRLAYALLTIHLLWRFSRHLAQVRSDSDEFSLQWLVWLIGVSSVLNALDLVRLNFQVALGAHLNMLGFAFTTLSSLLIIMGLIWGFNYHRDKLAKLSTLKHTLCVVEDNNPATQPKEQCSEYQAIFSHLDEQIQSNQWFCQTRLTLQQLSALSGLQSRDISRAINLVAGKSYNDYINELRVKHIKQKLKDGSNDTLLDIALAAGFSSKATFNQAFKKLEGQTPSQYRKTRSS